MNVNKEFIQSLLPTIEVVNAYPTGSRYVCDPPVLDTDVDYVVLVNENVHHQTFEARLVQLGWQLGGSENLLAVSPFCSYKQTLAGTTVNLIFVSNQPYFDRYVLATKVCKKLNLLDKKDRVMVFQAVLNHEFQPNWPAIELPEPWDLDF